MSDVIRKNKPHMGSEPEMRPTQEWLPTSPTSPISPISTVGVNQDDLLKSLLAALPKQGIVSHTISEDKCVTKLNYLKSKVAFLDIVDDVTKGDEDRITNIKSEFKLLYKALKKYKEADILYNEFDHQHKLYEAQASALLTISQRQQKEYLQNTNQEMMVILKLLDDDKIAYKGFIDNHLKSGKSQYYKPIVDLKEVHKKFFIQLKDPSIEHAVEDYCNSCGDSYNTLRGDDALHWFGVCSLYSLGENY